MKIPEGIGGPHNDFSSCLTIIMVYCRHQNLAPAVLQNHTYPNHYGIK